MCLVIWQHDALHSATCMVVSILLCVGPLERWSLHPLHPYRKALEREMELSMYTLGCVCSIPSIALFLPVYYLQHKHPI